MQIIRQHKSTFAILGVLLFCVFSLLCSLFVSPVRAVSIAEIENNGSRLVAKSDGTPIAFQWMISDTADGTYTPITDATQSYYDITPENEGKFVKVDIDGIQSDAIGPIGKLIIMDVGKSTVSLGTSYSGKDSDGNTVSGTHISSNIYVIVQADQTKTSNRINFSGHLPDAPFDVTLAGVNMGLTSYSSSAPDASPNNTNYSGMIDIPNTSSNQKKVTLRLKGENIIRAIHYYTAGTTASLKITDVSGNGATNGKLYIPEKVAEEDIDAFVAQSTTYNHWNAGIGGDDSNANVNNFHIAGGTIQVITTYGDNCTAIGAGGNGSCNMTISGGKIIAHCSGTGAAIGGGIGWHSAGGTSVVNITGGDIYAKNHGKIYVKATYKSDGSINTTKIVSATDDYNEIIGGVAIGSGSSVKSSGSKGNVNISGGTIKAYGSYGNGIGGGNSSSSAGGEATITITGGTVEASSIGGGDSKNKTGGKATVNISGTADVTLLKGIGGGRSESGDGGEATITVTGGTLNCTDVIGGGNGGNTGNGGKAIITVEGGSLTSHSIGGGTGGIAGNGGAAEIYVSGGTIITGSIGGGQTLNEAGQLGYAKAEISGGDITGQFLMAAGGTQQCSFTMTGGTVHEVNTANDSYAEKNGGAVYMDDPDGIIIISGGTISDCYAQNGGAIYLTAGTCSISGTATIQNCSSTENGGAIYMGGGTLSIDGGNIQKNTSDLNGGAIYLGGGTMTVLDGNISNNTAMLDGGVAYIDGGNINVSGGNITHNKATNNGGGFAINNGNFKMTGGNIDSNSAINGAGGGFYVSADKTNVSVDVLSGSVSHNSAKGNGGAFAVVGNNDGTDIITVNVGINKNHFDENGNALTDCEHGNVGENAFTCPILKDNTSSASGGGIYVTGNTSTVLNIYCLEESGSHAENDNGLSNFMKVDGGKVTITTSEQHDVENQTSHHGNTYIKSEIYATGGQMDIWGEMTNPRLEDIITVDIKKEDDYFHDHRVINEEDKYYKLLYFENFTDPVTNITTGQYKEIEVRHDTSVIISGNIYSHPGYTIKGWNTSNGRPNLDNYPQGTYPNDRGWYNVGDEKLFDGTIIGDLTIYAIWEANGYTVIYDPNVPAGETYTGIMENFNFTYDLPTKLSKNQYARPGYDFVGWCKTPDGSSTIYKDEETVTNLTTQKGEVVTLYAQWQACDHDPATHEYTYSVIDDGKTLKRDCSCGRYSEEARLFAENKVYNQNTHKAKIVYTSTTWKPTEVYEALDGDVLVDGYPYHAGNYKVSITENGFTASVIFTVEKKEQPAPPKPVFDTDKNADGSVMSIFPVDASPLIGTDDTYSSYPEYRIVYYEGGIEKTTDWVKGADTLIDGKYAAQFNLDKALTNYHIQARYSECDNYKASPESTADSVYFFTGNVEFVVNCGEGVLYTIKTADGTDVTINGIEIQIFTKDGYFFPFGYKASIQTENAENDAQATLSPENAFSEIYSINNIPTNTKVILTLPSAKKAITITSNIAEKQVFGKITSSSATISRDSAYTVNYGVTNYSSSEYDPLVLSFDKELPLETTIILQDKTNNAYYWTSVKAAGTYELPLTSFARMGDPEKTAFVLTDGDMELQFIIDFSKSEGGLAGDSVITTLSADKKTGSFAPSKQSDATAGLKNVCSYNMSTTAVGLIEFSHISSEGAASKWDNRDDALVFKPQAHSILPSDAHLLIVCENATTVIYANRDGNFVYSMPDLTSGTIRASLLSNMLGEGSLGCAFDVEWIVAGSKAEYSPMNIDCVANTTLNVLGIGQSPILCVMNKQ